MKRAPENYFKDIAQILLNAGNVDFDSRDIGHCGSDCTQLLRAAENRRNIYDKTALPWAVANGCDVFTKLLLEKGVDVESKNWGRTPLEWAAAREHEAIVQLLLKKGDELETEDEYGRTLLLCAAVNGHEAVFQ